MLHAINPIVIREIRGRMRSARAFWLLAGFLVALTGTMMLVYSASYVTNGSNASTASEIGTSVFLTLIGTAMLVLVLLATIMAASSIAGERERQTFDLLLTSQLSPGAIVVGKVLATMAYVVLLLSAMTPLIAIPLLIGGVDVGELCIMYAVILSNVCVVTCSGVYWSSRARTPLIAIGFALASVIGVLFGFPLLAITVPTIWQTFTPNTDILSVLAYIVLPIHPLATLYFTDTAIREQQVWLTTLTVGTVTLTLPAMWIVCIIESWLVSLGCIAAAMRRLWQTN